MTKLLSSEVATRHVSFTEIPQKKNMQNKQRGAEEGMQELLNGPGTHHSPPAAPELVEMPEWQGQMRAVLRLGKVRWPGKLS